MPIHFPNYRYKTCYRYQVTDYVFVHNMFILNFFCLAFFFLHSWICTIVLQIRLFGGSAITHTFKATDTLVDVNRHILMNRTDDGSPYSLVMNFPKKIFQPSDMDKTLKQLGKQSDMYMSSYFVMFRVGSLCCSDLGQATIMYTGL